MADAIAERAFFHRSLPAQGKSMIRRTFGVHVAILVLTYVILDATTAQSSSLPQQLSQHSRTSTACSSTCRSSRSLTQQAATSKYLLAALHVVPRGGAFGFPAGWHPFGYAISGLGKRYLEFEGSRDGDVGRFLSSLVTGRKSRKALREQWLEVTRVSKKRQSMRIYRTMDDLIDFCLEAGFID